MAVSMYTEEFVSQKHKFRHRQELQISWNKNKKCSRSTCIKMGWII